ncbi:RNA polymerase sigma factor [Roseateles cellulosilyticus]|uniref:Sigma-70 family RNA polymerase sigma factor n=1 Tax=Pelomonas cellulosilytica TaxID=2906762 RepID=A0ABS8XNE1_9BURK|nr:sigma-70 family RNA polymerase sigma factor [Pelomonas sp. P8]MCE4554284.1 sigma-70 family RNA polymerase sigma factor [Pelomonas sp. P8]
MSARLVRNWQEVFARVRGALCRRGRTEHEADDFVQEAWMRMACYEDERQPVDQPEAFLMRTALNLSIDAHRLNVSHGEHVLAEHEVLIDAAPSTEAVVLARERTARLEVCLGRLPAKTRDVFLASRLDGLPYTEIAKLYGLNVSTVHAHVAKATLRLTTWMEGW